jgi:hypothetical protein
LLTGKKFKKSQVVIDVDPVWVSFEVHVSQDMGD